MENQLNRKRSRRKHHNKNIDHNNGDNDVNNDEHEDIDLISIKSNISGNDTIMLSRMM